MITNRLHVSEFEYNCQQEARHEEWLASTQHVNKLSAQMFEEKKNLLLPDKLVWKVRYRPSLNNWCHCMERSGKIAGGKKGCEY